MARVTSRLKGLSVGFSARGTNMLFEDNIIFNGDDCLTVGSPAKNIHFRNSYCNGGHGLSIGSLGKAGAVADVQNVLYVVCVLGVPVSLMSLSKNRKRYHGGAAIVTGIFRSRIYPSGTTGKLTLRSKVQELGWGKWYCQEVRPILLWTTNGSDRIDPVLPGRTSRSIKFDSP